MYINIILALASLLSTPFEAQLALAGENISEIQLALADVPTDQRLGMEWLIMHMPVADLQSLSSEFLLSNCNLAYEAWRGSPWSDEITEAIFFDTILPYASVNERRDNWRDDFRQRFSEVVKDTVTPSQAAVMLNQQLYNMVGVKYSTDRPKADQSPYESIEAGMASCTGLSILLVDACRSVGVPARFVGTPLWYNETGNHSWVEIWDNGWHFTGAAEPTGDNLDAAWFAGSASKATKGDPKHAIFAVTWNESSLHFPLVWLPNYTNIGAVDVTDRYTHNKKEVHDELVPIRIVVYDKHDKRISVSVRVVDVNDEVVFEGVTNTEAADANDHLTAMLEKGAIFTVFAESFAGLITASDETILEFHQNSLSECEARYQADVLWKQRAKRIKKQRSAEMQARVIEYEGMKMPFWYTVYGDAPKGRRSLWISMHGGGGAPSEVNDSQWENQKKLYELEEGVYLVPRAPTNTYNLWHQSHIDPMFERLIENMIVFEGVDPNRVYILGYSAGGDGVYQLAPRMADRIAAAGMMAGHPNETIPDGLRNIGFALHVGAEDAAYDRNKIGRQWKEKLLALQEADPEGYAHQVVIHEGKGHWMDHEESVALPWMATFTRNPYPKKVVWVQDDVLHDRLYWLGVREPKQGTKIVATLENQTLTILEVVGDPEFITVYLNDTMVNFDEPLTLKQGDRIWGTVPIHRDPITITSTLRDQSDYYSGRINFSFPWKK